MIQIIKTNNMEENMNVSKKSKQLKLTTDQSKLLFNYFDATNKMKSFKTLRDNLKDSAVTIVDANNGQVFTRYKGKNIYAKTKHKEYFTLDLERLKKERPTIYNEYRSKVVNSVTLEVNID